ncbi:MAG: hypothetical protein SCALA702_06480 [Melioribacteraceae bacterium]|nr:MAG: hypothetical protein SCALA702_06480 [Melioribacteraceae bacterium]
MKTVIVVLFCSFLISAQSIGVKYLPAAVDSNKSLTADYLYDFALEFSPASILVGTASDALTLSAGYLNYSLDRNAEIAVPFMLYTQLGGQNDDHTFIVDLCYRKFVTEYQRGFYINAAFRIANFSHNRDVYYTVPLSYDWHYRSESENITKIGLAFGIGYRLISRKGFVWGVSLSVGRYFNDLDKHSYSTDETFPVYVSDKLYLDIELLKIGYAF